MARINTNRIGETNKNYQGCEMKIIKYNKANDITVEFDNGFVAHNICYSNFKKGSVKNLYFPEVYGVGFIGEGEYKARENSKRMTKRYKVWFAMMLRCYGSNKDEYSPSYEDCSVCKEWHNFQTFCKWYDENYYEIEDNKMQLDKDILHKGNKIYSPENCVFVPQRLNAIVLRTQGKRGDLPMGVIYYKKNKKYGAQCRIGVRGRRKYLGLFETPEKAFEVYKKFKEKYIKQIADEYKSKIPQKLYDALYNYKVEIDD